MRTYALAVAASLLLTPVPSAAQHASYTSTVEFERRTSRAGEVIRCVITVKEIANETVAFAPVIEFTPGESATASYEDPSGVHWSVIVSVDGARENGFLELRGVQNGAVKVSMNGSKAVRDAR